MNATFAQKLRTSISVLDSRHYLVGGVFFCVLVFIGMATNVGAQSGYSVQPSSQTITSGTVEVAWSAPSDRRVRQGWVGLYESGATNSQYRSWQYIDQRSDAGTLTFRNVRPGTYEARLFEGFGFTKLSNSSTFTVGETTNGTDTPPPSTPTPEPDPGNGSGGQYSLTNTANSFTGDTVTIAWSAPADRSVRVGWVGIYQPGAPNGRYHRWTYIDRNANNGTVTIANVRPGTYEARLFEGNGFTNLATSNTFTVGETTNGTDTPPPSTPTPEPDPGNGSGGQYLLTLSETQVSVGQTVTVSFAAPADSNRRNDWVGVYEPGAANTRYLAYRYTGGGTTGTLTFLLDRAGTFEFRYFKNNGYQVVATAGPLRAEVPEPQCPVSNLDSITNYPPRSGPIIAFGDSVTAGVGASAGNDYVSQLERLAGVSIVNAGVSGDTTRDALARLNSDVLSRNPSVVLLWIGGNDVLGQYYLRVEQGLEQPATVELYNRAIQRLFGGVPQSEQVIPVDETFANLNQIVQRLQSNGAVVIMLGYSGTPFATNLEARYRQVAEQNGALYVPTVLSGILGRPSRMSDLIHPNDTGYGIVAERVLPYLLCTQ